MKTKLTVSIEEDVLPRAKRAAKAKGVSLSSVIENTLRDLAEERIDFVGKWRGRFRLASSNDPRSRYLRKKYVADPD